jgi:hypothetical protein
MTHHPHVHMIASGGGISPDGTRWVSCRRGFFLPVLVLSALFRRLLLGGSASAGIRNPSRKLTFEKLALKAADPSRADARFANLSSGDD